MRDAVWYMDDNYGQMQGKTTGKKVEPYCLFLCIITQTAPVSFAIHGNKLLAKQIVKLGMWIHLSTQSRNESAELDKCAHTFEHTHMRPSNLLDVFKLRILG